MCSPSAAKRATIVGATSGDTGGAAIDAFAGRERTDIFILFPHGKVSPVQQRQMTTSSASNVHALAVEGQFRRLPEPRQGDVQRRGLPRQGASFRASTRSTGRASWPRWSIISRAPSRSADRTGKSPFTVPTGNFGDIFAGYVAKQHGPARSTGW